MKPPDPLAPKRKRLAKILLDVNTARLQALAANPMMDISAAPFERMANPAELERMTARFDEGTLDMLIAYHDPSGSRQPRYVW